LFSSCDETHCGIYKFRNNSDHKVALLSYRDASFVIGESFEALLNGNSWELEGSYCNFGYPSPPFSIGVIDSIVLFFDDTLRVTLYSDVVCINKSIYEDETPLEKVAWTEVKTTNKGTRHHYEYEFTNWHYQKALEANGYDID
jgi:hypothetical protein